MVELSALFMSCDPASVSQHIFSLLGKSSMLLNLVHIVICPITQVHAMCGVCFPPAFTDCLSLFIQLNVFFKSGCLFWVLFVCF